jgi:hypothetical protein
MGSSGGGGVSEPQHDLVSSLEADLRALAAADADLERDAEIAERTRIERSTITLRDRLRGCHGPVEVTTSAGSSHAGRVGEVGNDWVTLQHVPPGQHVMTAEHLVLLSAVLAVRGLGRSMTAHVSPIPERSARAVLRDWCRDRSEISALLVDGTVVTGLASATFADHLEISTGGGATVSLPCTALAVISR